MIRLRLPFINRNLKSKNQDPEKEISSFPRQDLPKHVAIIMDGNGRWAKNRGLPRAVGHRKGVESLKEVVVACLQVGIEVLTVYAFSTENWKRPKEEVDILMNLLVEYLQKEISELNRQGVKIQPIGEIAQLPQVAINELQRATQLTWNNSKLILNLALNYGGRTEILQASREVAQLVSRGELKIEEINEEVFSEHLFTKGLPDPDLLIRPSGEYRISNFLLWQLAYTEFWITDTLWPDFRKEHLLEAIRIYLTRDRRFGGLKL